MQWFEDNEQYTDETPVPAEIPYDKLSLIRVHPTVNKTQPGWGAADFMENYLKNAFDPERAVRHFRRYSAPFAFVMRSLPWICVDIDGKNGGVPTARVLNLPPTFAETSKSGNGYHLFYKLSSSQWNELRGYDEFPDVNGLVPGIDIRGTGVVYHFPQQRWNSLPVAELPPSLATLIGRVKEVKRAARLTREGTKNLDEDELIMVWDDLLEALNKPIQQGMRNARLYKLGARMAAAEYPHWDTELIRRGTEVGLPSDEIDDLIHNISEYS